MPGVTKAKVAGVLAAAVLGAGAAVGVAACGSDDETTDASSSVSSAADEASSSVSSAADELSSTATDLTNSAKDLTNGE